LAHHRSQVSMYGLQSAIALVLIAVVLVACLRMGDVKWRPIILIISFVPMIVLVVRHGQKQHYEMHRALQYQATHDSLTGLPNRALFQERLLASIQLGPASRPFAVALIDLDGFKAVNDRYGHLAGDALLRAVAERLRESLRATDTVARFGGDEFALILEGIADTCVLLERCYQLRDVLAEPYRLNGPDSDLIDQVSASIGIALGTNQDAEGLIRKADQALYQAKAAGKNCCVLSP
jgi:diguanylate cyclase (GGDEF)-like protein